MKTFVCPPILKLLFFLFTLFFGFSSLCAPMDQAKLAPPLAANIWTEMTRITRPAVVGIYMEVNAKSPHFKRDPLFDFFEEFFGQGFEFKAPRPQDEEKIKPIGTGFIIDKKGHILTNYHVIEAVDNPRLKTKLQVQIHGENKLLDVEILGRDQRGDIALLKLVKPIKNLTPLEFGDSDKLQVGEYVAAFGNPYGHSDSVTVGIVSAKGRAIKELNRFPFIQTDASINPGNSGGPLLNTKGYVIGVNTAIDARAQGIGFAIPSNYVKKVVGIIKAGGTIQRAFMGVGLATLNRVMAQRRYGIKKGGVVITQVEPGYPADKAGLQPNDIIFEFNGHPIHSAESLIYRVQDTEVGRKVEVKVLRKKKNSKNLQFKEISFQVKLTNFPENDKKLAIKKTPNNHPGQIAPYNLGFSIVNHSLKTRKHYKIPGNLPQVPIVSRVKPGSPAHQAQIRPGNLIVKVNNKMVRTVTDVIKALRKGENTLNLRTSRGRKQVRLKSS